MKKKTSEHRLCAFCKLPHRHYFKKDIHPADVLGLFLVTGIFSFLVWGLPEIRSLILFIALAVSLQLFFRVRWRQSLRCPHCGFDPIVYKTHPNEAAQTVKVFLDNRKTDPRFLLRTPPKIKPIIQKTDTWKQNLPAIKDNEPPVPGLDRQI